MDHPGRPNLTPVYVKLGVYLINTIISLGVTIMKTMMASLLK